MKRIILHHSLTKDGNVVDFNAIKKYHIETLKFNDIGYHEVIEIVNGKPTHFEGRDRFTTGAHAAGQNIGTLGICIVGDFDKEAPSKEIIDYLCKRLDFYRNLYGSIQIEGHCDHPNPANGYIKTCPGKLFPLQEIKDRYNTPDHWAEQPYQYLLQNWVDTLDRRFDDNMSRGEHFSLLARILKRLEEQQ